LFTSEHTTVEMTHQFLALTDRISSGHRSDRQLQSQADDGWLPMAKDHCGLLPWNIQPVSAPQR